MKRKISTVQLFRHIVQFISFILFPGLFIMAYSSIKSVVMAIVNGTFSIDALSSDIAIMVAVLSITILFGRFFCGFICTFGAMGDLLYYLSGFVLKKHPNINQKVDAALKYVKYVILFALVAFVWILGVSLNENYNPWYIFGIYSNLSAWTSMDAWISVGGVLLLIIIVVSFFFERFFCRYLCPLGALLSILSKVRLFRIYKSAERCVGCNLCDKKCSMSIHVSAYEMVKSGECINCMKCVDVCPTRAISSNAQPVVAGTIATVGISGLYYAGTILPPQMASINSAVEMQNNTQSGAYLDGTYTGTGQGFRGDITVEVTVVGGAIQDITVTSQQEDAQFFNRAESTVIEEILSSQSIDVTPVSGATFSSNGIIEAVSNALGKDVISEQPLDEEESTQQEESTNETEKSSEANSEGGDVTSLTDGTYTGTGQGFRGDITVEVTVVGGAIQDITVTSQQEDAQFFNRAESTVIEEILSSQSIDVTPVSGATFSSNGIIEAVSNALNLEFENPNTTNAQSGHGGRPNKRRPSH